MSEPGASLLRITVVSGGQTGVDRGALDAALDEGVRCGGWCPADRLAEDGAIPVRYPLTPVPGGDYEARTRRNVLDSDGTVIIHFGPPAGGTRTTLECCVTLGKPHLLVDAARLPPGAAAQRIASFAASLGRGLLNVAGPRASEAPGAHAYAREAVAGALRALRARAAERPAGGGPLPWAGPESTAPVTRDGAHIMASTFCHSCAAPLQAPGFAGPAENLCRYCTDAEGRLKKKKVIRAGIARWMQTWQPDLGDKEARRRARRYMRSMPAWAD